MSTSTFRVPTGQEPQPQLLEIFDFVCAAASPAHVEDLGQHLMPYKSLFRIVLFRVV